MSCPRFPKTLILVGRDKKINKQYQKIGLCREFGYGDVIMSAVDTLFW